MKSKIAFLLFSFIFLFCNSYSADLSECDTSVGSGYYTLNQSVNTTGSCFFSTNDNVELNCQGFTVNTTGGDGTYGFGAGSDNNITIRNCVFVGFDYSVATIGGNEIRFINNTVLSVNATGTTNVFRISTSTNVTISNNTINAPNGGSYRAIDVENSEDVQVYNNQVTGGDISIYVFNGDSIRVQSNTVSITANNDRAIHFFGVENSSIYSNTLYDQAGTQVSLIWVSDQSSNISVYSNNIYNGTYSLDFQDAEYIRAYSNNVYNSSASTVGAIILNNANHSTIYSNNVYNSADYGISVLAGSNNNTIYSNTVDDSTDASIYIEGNSFDNTFYLNTITNSNDEDLVITGAGSVNNVFYLNTFSNASKFNVGVASNYFNNSQHGNLWNDINCLSSTVVGSYNVCTNPANYTVETGIYDFRPIASAVQAQNSSSSSNSVGFPAMSLVSLIFSFVIFFLFF